MLNQVRVRWKCKGTHLQPGDAAAVESQDLQAAESLLVSPGVGGQTKSVVTSRNKNADQLKPIKA